MMCQTYLPSSIGNCNCVGQSFAVTELETIFPKLLANYSFKINTELVIDYGIFLKYASTHLKLSHVKFTSKKRSVRS